MSADYYSSFAHRNTAHWPYACLCCRFCFIYSAEVAEHWNGEKKNMRRSHLTIKQYLSLREEKTKVCPLQNFVFLKWINVENKWMNEWIANDAWAAWTICIHRIYSGYYTVLHRKSIVLLTWNCSEVHIYLRRCEISAERM